jgi:tetratricopeptide (TPR) repeat protein
MQNKKYNPFLWIAGLGTLVYLWTVFFGFTYFDDNTLILDNLFFLRNLANIPAAFVTDVFHVLHSPAAYYRPLLTVSFMFDSLISGSNPFFYHLTNVIVHIVTSCVVFIFMQRIKIKKEIAFLLSVIFAVHPVLSQAVAWIPARDDSLLTLFTLLSFIFFINFIDSGKIKNAVWHLVFLAAAVFTKESGLVIIPVIVFYYLLFEGKRLLSSKLSIAFLWAGIVGIWFFLRTVALPEPIKYSLAEVGKSIYMGLPALVLDLGKVFFPFNLSVLTTLQDSTLVWGYAAVALIFLLIIFSKNKNYRLILFGAIWFLIFLLPTFIRPGTGYDLDFFEYRLYLPIIGLFIVLSEVSVVKKFNLSDRKSIWILGIIAAALIIINFTYISVYRDRLTFWQSAAITASSNSLAHKNLGAMYYLTGNLDKAEVEYKKTLELNPAEAMVHNNLGLIYVARGDIKTAEDEYRKELEINPRYDNALFNYGLLFYNEGKKEEAEKMWLEVLKVNPDYVDAIRNLFILYYQNNDKTKANLYYGELQKRGINLQGN